MFEKKAVKEEERVFQCVVLFLEWVFHRKSTGSGLAFNLSLAPALEKINV